MSQVSGRLVADSENGGLGDDMGSDDDPRLCVAITAADAGAVGWLLLPEQPTVRSKHAKSDRRRMSADLANKWVDLSWAATGNPRGSRYANVLEIARHGANASLVRFPLSATHYMELARARFGRTRNDVGSIMNELSRQKTICASTDLLPGEIDRACRDRWGRPTTLREVAVFGHGAAHAFNSLPEVRFHSPAELDVDDETRRRIEQHFTAEMEKALVTGPIADWPFDGLDPVAQHDPIREKHAREERELGELLRSTGFKGERPRDAWTARMLIEFNRDTVEAMLRCGLDPDLLTGNGKAGLNQFLHDLPVASAVFEIRWRRHRNPTLGWTANDINDMHSLATAVVHCDVVVTERHAASILREAGLDTRHGTTILTDLADLARILVAVAV